jgi:alpha-tubulin suppressor-like RCC1 family protein
MKRIICSYFVYVFTIAPSMGFTQCFDKIFAGTAHALGQKTDGTLWTWGSGANGGNGNGSTADELTPILLCNATSYRAISTSFENSNLFIKSNGTLWVCGNNGYGQLALPTSINSQYTLTQIGSSTDWQTVTCRTNSTFAIKTNGTLWAWGYNQYYNLGLGYAGADVHTPTQVGTDTNWKAVFSAAFGSVNVAQKTNGTLWSWGAIAPESTPYLFNADTDWATVSNGGSHFLALKTDGSLWSWGGSTFGECGFAPGTVNTTNANPYHIPGTWSKICAGLSISFGIKQDGTLWGWGRNGKYETDGTNLYPYYTPLGVGVPYATDVYIPTQVGTDNNWKEVYAHDQFVLALKTDGSLWVWGNNYAGNFGNGTATGEIYQFTDTPAYTAVSGCTLATVNAVKETGIRVEPNPATDVATLYYPKMATDAKIQLIDLQGRTILQEEVLVGSTKIELSTMQLPQGIYVLTILQDNQPVYQTKLIKK